MDDLRIHDGLIITDVQNDFCRGGALVVQGSGLALDYCVAETARDARARRLDMNLLLEATRAVNVVPRNDARTIERMKAAGVRIVEGT